ncbi:MAG: GHKL domain-containing protein [Oscillospiraceae bacterium]
MIDFLWAAFEFLVTVFQSFLCIYFVCAFLEHDFSTKKGKLIYFFGSIGFLVIVYILNFFVVYEGIFGVIYSLAIFIFALFFLKGSVFKKIFIAIFTNVITICVSTFVAGAVSAAFKNNINEIYGENTLARFLLIAIVQSILVYIFGLILRTTSHKYISLKPKEWGLILSVFATSFISLAFLHMAQLSTDFTLKDTKFLLISELGIIIVNIVCFYMTTALSRSNCETTELKIYRQQQEYRLQYAENVKMQYEETRQIRHDMKQNFAVLNALLKENKINDAIDYTEKCSENLSKLNTIVDIGNDFVNAIINSKLNLAKENGIKTCSSFCKNISGIENIDLCNLIGNVFDNAIEACLKCPVDKRGIEATINSDESKILFTVSNSIVEGTYGDLSDLETDKENKDLHGFGIRTINSIAKKYLGNASFYIDGGKFYCQVLLYI